MSINLLETIQKNLGYPALQKIDPNTQEVVMDEKTREEDKFSQSAIPAVLTAFYKYVHSDTGANKFLERDLHTNWLSEIFPENKKKVVETISSYSQQSGEDPVNKINSIATISVVLA